MTCEAIPAGSGQFSIGVVAQARYSRELLVEVLGTTLDFDVRDLGDGDPPPDMTWAEEGSLILVDQAPGIIRRLIHDVHSARPDIRFVALNVGDRDESEVLSLFEAGVSGYVPRDGSMTDVAAACRAALLGELDCPPRIAAALVRRLRDLARTRSRRAPDLLLSPAENRVIRLVEQSLTNKEIASRLGLSPATVKNHIGRILKKLHVHGRREAIRRYAADTGEERS